jgi:hypothetical protein
MKRQIVGFRQRQNRCEDYQGLRFVIVDVVQSGDSMLNNRQVIHVHLDAAPKPPRGAPCNGCGICCLLEPCPLGVILSGRRHGTCVAVRWQDDVRQYRCGALCEPVAVLQHVLPAHLQRLTPGLAAGLAPILTRWAQRWIAVGQGCDSSLDSALAEQPRVDAKIH